MTNKKRVYRPIRANELKALEECRGLGIDAMKARLPHLDEKKIRSYAKRYGVTVVNFSKPYSSKYSDDEIAAICELKSTGLTWAEIATAYESTAPGLKSLVNRRLRKGALCLTSQSLNTAKA